MSDEIASAALPTGGPSDKEKDQRGKDGLLTMIETIRRNEREAYEAEMAEALRDLTGAKRDGLPEFDRIETRSSPTDPLYRRLPEDEREWRNPDSDHYMAQWIRGRAYNDRATMLQAHAKLEQMFPRAVMTEGTALGTGAVATGTGAELVPRPLQNVVMIARDRIAKMRRFATIYQMTTQETNIPTAAAMTAAMVLEGTGAAQSEPAIAQVPLIAHVAGVQARATKELVEDAAYNLVTILSTRGGTALGKLEDEEFLKAGTGTKPHVTKISGTGYVLQTGAALAYTDMLGIYHTCGQQYRGNAVWFISSSVLQLLGNVRDGMGRPMYQGMTETPAAITDDPGAAGTIFRKPVYEMDLTSGDIFFGDPSQYAIGDRRGITIEVSNDARFLTREVVWMITERIAGNNTDTAAMQYTTAITSASSL
jgi:HK97 family phage major capsid protein